MAKIGIGWTGLTKRKHTNDPVNWFIRGVKNETCAPAAVCVTTAIDG
jgi:hypothetical protein